MPKSVLVENTGMNQCTAGYTGVANVTKRGRRTMPNPSIQKLDEIAKLGNNWNGYGAEPFSPKLLQEVRKILKVLRVSPGVYPIAGGAIQLEFNNDGNYLEMEIDGNYPVTAYLVGKNGEEGDITISSIIQMKRVVNEFYGRNV